MSEPRTDPNQLRPYLDAGWQLIPLHRWDYKDGKGRDRGKTPLHPNWTRRPYSSKDQVGHMEDGGNVGVRLTASQLVVDVDPRNFGSTTDGVDPFSELVLSLGLDPTGWPCVETGSGGWHFYLTKPEDASVVDGLPDYPGVEFKTIGRQVVAAGSLHPSTGRLYEWDFLSAALAEAPAAPDALLDLIARPSAPAGALNGGGEYSADQIARMLSALDPEEFRDHDEWFRLMLACHHASAGAAKAEFLSWSARDPEYADRSEEVGRRWDSLSAERPDGAGVVTHLTLHWILREHGAGEASLRPVEPQDDFDVVTDDDLPDGLTEPASKGPRPLPDNTPMTVAREMLRGKHILRSKGDWLRYDRSRNAFVAVTDEDFEARVWRWIDGRPYETAEGPKRIVAGRDSVANVVKAAIALRQGPKELPAWGSAKPDDPDPSDLLAVRNGLLHLPTMDLLPPTPRFVNRNASPVEFDPLADEPDRWQRFLGEVFEGDEETVSTLQEVMGYLLTQDTSQQKVFCLVGPIRSGKGTINRVLQLLIGDGNYSSPTAKDLAKGDFGLQRLIGRQLVTISDMRLRRNADPAALSENLLRISGEDEVSVDRKYKDAWEGRLSARFLLLSNEVPQFRDTSGAIVSRMILMRSDASFYEREDPGLIDKLKPELPGILNWALAGLRRLRERGHFVQPEASRSELATMMTLASPVRAFAAERLRKDPEAVTPKDEIWSAFLDWVQDEGLPYTGDKGHFFKDLGTVGFPVHTIRPRIEGGRVQAVQGIALIDAADVD